MRTLGASSQKFRSKPVRDHDPDYTIHFDAVTKHRYMLYLRGFLRNEDGVRRELKLDECGDKNGSAQCWTHQRKIDSEHHTAFECYLIFDRIVNVESLVLEFVVDGVPEVVCLQYQDVRKRTLQHKKYEIDAKWAELMKDTNIKKVLDVGGRARSGVSRKGNYFGKEVTVADIISAPDVDFVGDAHQLSSVVPLELKFDAFISVATFEHLLMPWKAAIEINQVLRPGGVGLIVSHQTLGMHEVPWDFYRYSDTGWHGIFNSGTGFEIVDAAVCKPAMILPLSWAAHYDNSEGAVGFLQSGVIVRKTGEPKENWKINVDDILNSSYPH